MTQRIREQAKEAAIIKVLEYVNFEPGATATDINRFAKVNHALDVLLPEMIQAGLIERQEEPAQRNKPIFITDTGRRHLEAARQGKTSSASRQCQDWSSRESPHETERAIATFIRNLPEFRESDDDRIQQVSQELANAIARSASRPR